MSQSTISVPVLDPNNQEEAVAVCERNSTKFVGRGYKSAEEELAKIKMQSRKRSDRHVAKKKAEGFRRFTLWLPYERDEFPKVYEWLKNQETKDVIELVSTRKSAAELLEIYYQYKLR